ncbi:hypothetical protein THAOC_21534, partial [Thalassiosira oceanica]
MALSLGRPGIMAVGWGRMLLMLALFYVLANDSNGQLFPDDEVSQDYYCGYDWVEANAGCQYPCPSGSDADCPP